MNTRILVLFLALILVSPLVASAEQSADKDEGIVSLRIWYTPPYQMCTLQSSNETVRIHYSAAFLGLYPEEAKITGVNNTIIKGRWFNDEDYMSCIISSSLAEALKVHEQDIISVLGFKLKIVGIMDGDKLASILDLDQQSITPLDILAPEERAITSHLPGNTTIIIPGRLAITLGSIYSIAIKFKDPNLLLKEAYKLNEVTKTDIYAGVNGSVHIFRLTKTLSAQGWSFLAIPMVITTLITMNTMLGLLQERTKEIGIYSSLGLPPKNIA